MKISVCVNTYRRPHIYDTLLSVWNQSVENGEIELIVSDNDDNASGKFHVDRFIEQTGANVDYNVVPEKNIAIARNDAVRRATGDWVAFIDDDEIAPPGWISTLLHCANTYDADLVQGPVVSTYAPGVAPWILEADPMSKRWGPTGTRLRYASTCNLLVRASLLKTGRQPFNPKFGKMGNDDGEMSYRLYRAGARIIACSDRAVIEAIPADRGNVGYLRIRNRGFGQAYIYLVRDHMSALGMAHLFVISLLNSLIFLVLSELMRPISKARWLKLRIRYWINLGKVDYFLSPTKIENY